MTSFDNFRSTSTVLLYWNSPCLSCFSAFNPSSCIKLRGILLLTFILSLFHRFTSTPSDTLSLRLADIVYSSTLRPRLPTSPPPTAIKTASNLTLTILTLLLAGGIQLHPGPKFIYPCGFCDTNVSWGCKGIACDACNIWYHHDCVDLASAEWERLGQHQSIQWICPRCDGINCDSFTYNSFELSLTNSFSPLSDFNQTIDSFTSDSPLSPKKTSSPGQKKPSHPQNSPPNNVQLCIHPAPAPMDFHERPTSEL